MTTSTMNKNNLAPLYTKFQQINGHQGPIYALDQDHTYFYSASADKFVARWHKVNGQQDQFAVRCTQAPFSLFVEPSLKHLVIGLSDGHLHVIDTLQKQEVKNLIVHQSAVFAIHFNKFQQQYYTADADGLVAIWDANWQLLLQIPLACGKIRQIEIAPDGKYLMLACADGMIRQLDSTFFNEELQFQAHTDACTALSILPDGTILSAGKDAYVRRWTAAGQQLNAFPAHLGTIYQLKILNALHYVTASRDKTIKVWDLQTDQIVQRIDLQMAGHRHSINTVLCTENGFLSAGDDKRIIEWRLANLKTT